MFCNFYLAKNHKIANNFRTANAIKNKNTLGILRISEKILMFALPYLKKANFYTIKLTANRKQRLLYINCMKKMSQAATDIHLRLVLKK